MYLEMKDMATAEKARDLYMQALEKAENQYEPLWKLSRILYYIGDNTEIKKEKKLIFKRVKKKK